MLIIASSKHMFLSNKSFQYANIIAFCIEHNLKVINPSFSPFLKYFKTSKSTIISCFPSKHYFFRLDFLSTFFNSFFFYLGRIIVKSKINNNVLYVIESDWDKDYPLDENFLNLSKSKRILILQGFMFTNSLLLAKHRDRIKDFFSPRFQFQKNINQLIQQSRENTDVLIGIHIRHGDYKTYLDGRYFYTFDTYLNQMQQALLIFKVRVKFLICTNGVLENELFADFNIIKGTGHFIEDLYALAGCDYIIGPPSTYSMWASFYGNTPLYLIENPNNHFSLKDFKTYYT